MAEDELAVGSIDENNVESVGANDLGPLDLDERDREDQGDLGSFISAEAGGSGSNVLDKMDLEPSFTDEEDELADLQADIEPIAAFPEDEIESVKEFGGAHQFGETDEIQSADDLQPLDEFQPAEEIRPSEDDTLLASTLTPGTGSLGSLDEAPELEELKLDEEAPLELESTDEPLAAWGEANEPAGDPQSAPAEPVSAAEEAWSPFKTEPGEEVELPNPVEEIDELELNPIDEADEITPIQLDEAPPGTFSEPAGEPSAAEDEFTGFEIVADDEDPNKTMPFQFPDADEPKKENGGWDFLSGGKK